MDSFEQVAPRRRQSPVGWAALACAVALTALVGSFVSVRTAQDHERNASAEDASAEVVWLISAREAAEAALLFELNTRQLAAVGEANDRDVSFASIKRYETMATTVRVALRRVVTAGGGAGKEAAVLLDNFSQLGVMSDNLDLAPDVLRRGVEVSRADRGWSALTGRLRALDELSRVSGLAPTILDRAIRSDGEGLDFDRANAESYATDDAVTYFSAELGVIAAALRSSKVIAIEDRASSAAGGADTPAPFTIGEMAERTTAASKLVREVVAIALNDVYLGYGAAADDERSQARTWRQAAGALGGLAALAGAFAIVLVVRRVRWAHKRARLAAIDRLTGSGNRHELEDRTAKLIADDRFVDHLVAVLDLDRFKLINDTCGHAAGDAVLVEVVRRLRVVVAGVRVGHTPSESSIVRLGGDEFLCSLHSTDRIDVDDFTRQLEGLCDRPLVLEDGRSVPIEFSVGIATSHGPATLYDMMAVADLAVYEQKATRRAHGVTVG